MYTVRSVKPKATIDIRNQLSIVAEASAGVRGQNIATFTLT